MARRAAAVSLLLALASLALPSGPSYDPYAWLVWGRDLAHLDLVTSGSGTSWKPLPALVDALLTPLGGAAADGWLVIARAGALFALFMAARLAWRLAPRPQRALAAVLAPLLLALTHEWVRRSGIGDAEGLMTACGLLAIDRHLDGRRGQAWLLLVAAGLIRVEVWPFVLAYGLWLWTRRDGPRTAIAAGVALIPLLWFGGDWVGSGRLTTAADRALRPVPGSPGAAAHPALAVLGEAAGMLPPPAWIGLAIACATAVRRRRQGDRVLLSFAAAAAVWTLVVAAMAERGYAGLPRFLFMAAALEAVMAAVGWARAAGALGGLARSVPARRALAGAAVAAALALTAAGSISYAQRLPSDWAAIDRVADSDARLERSVRAAGSAQALARCDPQATKWYLVTALQWDLDVTHGRGAARSGCGSRS